MFISKEEKEALQESAKTHDKNFLQLKVELELLLNRIRVLENMVVKPALEEKPKKAKKENDKTKKVPTAVLKRRVYQRAYYAKKKAEKDEAAWNAALNLTKDENVSS